MSFFIIDEVNEDVEVIVSISPIITRINIIKSIIFMYSPVM